MTNKAPAPEQIADINAQLDILRQFDIAKALGILKRAGVGNPPTKGDNLCRGKQRA